VSANFPRAYTGVRRPEAALARLGRSSGASLVVATLGDAGSIAWHADRIIRSAALRVRPLDTTGAGDVFRAGFIAAWLRGRGETSLSALLRHANAAAGLSTLGAGAWGALPTWSAVRSRV